MNPRSAQALTAALAALLVILVGATLFVILSRPGPGPTPSPTPAPTLPSFVLPTPTTVAVVSPSASVPESPSVAPITPVPLPTASPSPASTGLASFFSSPTPSAPTPSPSPTPTPTATPTPTPTLPSTPSPPSPTPTIVPTAPERTLQILGVGIDDRMVFGSVPRSVTFNTDGPSTVTATISNASGQVRVCLWMEPLREQAICKSTRSGSVEQVTTDGGSATWTVSMIANGSSPTTSLAINFNANQPSATLDSFRYVGSSNPPYNGFDTQMDALADGQISMQAAFDDGTDGSYDWRLQITPQSGGAAFDQSGGPDSSVDQAFDVSKDGIRVTFSNPDPVSNPGAAVILTATITWP